MKRLAKFLLPVIAALHPDAGIADPIIYNTYRVTMSLTAVSLENKNGANVLVTRRFTNRQLINLAQGRDLEAVVPRNEVLVALLPENFTNPTALRLALMDVSTSSVIKMIMASDTAVIGYGPPGGNGARGVGSGTLAALTSPNFSVDQTTLSLSFSAIERPGPYGSFISATILSISGAMPLTINGVSVPAVVTGGSMRVGGPDLLDIYADL